MDDDLLFRNKFVSDLKVPSTYDIKNKNKEAAFRQYIDKKKDIVGLNDEDTDIFEEHVMTTNPLVVSKDGSLNKQRHVVERRYIYNISSKTRQITKEEYVEKEVVTGEYVKVTTNNFGETIYEPVDIDVLNLEYNALDIPNSVVNPFSMVGDDMFFKSFLYRTPDEYIINLPLMHTNVKSVRLLSSVIPCTITNINRYNNHVMIDILFGSTQVLENQDFDIVFGTYIMKIPYGNYTIDQVCSKITSLVNAFYYENYQNNTGNTLYNKVNMLTQNSFSYMYDSVTGELYFSLAQPSTKDTIETLDIIEPVVYENTVKYDPTGSQLNYSTVQLPLTYYDDFLHYIRTLVAAMNYDFCGYVLSSYINEFIVIEKENKRYLCSLFDDFNLDMTDPTYENIRQSLNLTSGVHTSTSTPEAYIVDITNGYNAFPSYDATTNPRTIEFSVGGVGYSGDIASQNYTTKESFFDAILNVMNSNYSTGNFSVHTHTLNNGTTGYSIKSDVEYTFTTMAAALSATIFGTSGTDIDSAPYGLYMIDITAGYNAFVNYNSTIANIIKFTVANTIYEPSIGNVFFTNYTAFINAIVDAMNDDVDGYPLGNFSFSTQQQLKFNNSTYTYELEDRHYIMSDVEFEFECIAPSSNVMDTKLSTPIFGSVNINPIEQDRNYVIVTGGYSAFSEYDGTTDSIRILFTVGTTNYDVNMIPIVYANADDFFNAIVYAMNTAYSEGSFLFDNINGIITSSSSYTFNVMNSTLSAAIFGIVQTADIPSVPFPSNIINVGAGYDAFQGYDATTNPKTIIFTVGSTQYSGDIVPQNYTTKDTFFSALATAMNTAYPTGGFVFDVSSKTILSVVQYNFNVMNPILSNTIFGIFHFNDIISTNAAPLYIVGVAGGYNAFQGYDANSSSTLILFSVGGTRYSGYINQAVYATAIDFFNAIVNAMNTAYGSVIFSFDVNSKTITSNVEYIFNVMNVTLSNTLFGIVHANTIISGVFPNFVIDITAGYESFSRYDASLVSNEIVFVINSIDYTALIDSNVYTSFVVFMQEIVGKMNAVQTSHEFSFIILNFGTLTKYYLACSANFNIKINPGDTDIRLSTSIFGVIPTNNFKSIVHSLLLSPGPKFPYTPTSTTEIKFSFNSSNFTAYIPSINYADYNTFITAVVDAMNITCKNGFFAFDREGAGTTEDPYRYTLYSAGTTVLKFSEMPSVGTVMVHPPTDSDITSSNFQIDLTDGYNAFVTPYNAYSSDYSKFYLNIRQQVPDPPFEDDPATTNVTLQIPLVAGTYSNINMLMTHIISQINTAVTGASWLKPNTSVTFGYSISNDIITIFCESTPASIYEFNIDGSLMVALASFLGISITTQTTYTTSYASPYNYGNRLRFKMSFENNPDVSQDDQLWYMLGFRSNNSLAYLDIPWTNLFDYGNDNYYFSSTSFVNNFVPNRSTEMLPDIEDKRPYRLPSMTKTNYIYLQLNNYENMYDPSIPNEKIYTKILLNEDYGKFAYDTFVDNPYVLSTTDSRLDRLQVKFIDKNANPVDFNNIDHTITIEIVEYSDRLSANDYNTRRGYNEHSSYPDALGLGYGK